MDRYIRFEIEESKTDDNSGSVSGCGDCHRMSR